MNKVTVAAIQASFGGSPDDNLARAENLARRAAGDGAQIILLPELFERPYFCKTQRAEFLHYAQPVSQNAAVAKMRTLAAELKVVLPVSFYELAGQVRFNSLAIIDADGALLGVYRKSHLPDGPGYCEKFYFSPGDGGFCVWQTKYACIGAGICWDQWFPEAARAMVLMGAQLLLYPTAIGDEPQQPQYDSSAHWQTVMRGHAAANIAPLVAANRIGAESQNDAFGNPLAISFYGQSFIANETGDIIARAEKEEDAIITAEFDFSEIAKTRAAWGLFRDRRPELYGAITKMDGTV